MPGPLAGHQFADNCFGTDILHSGSAIDFFVYLIKRAKRMVFQCAWAPHLEVKVSAHASDLGGQLLRADANAGYIFIGEPDVPATKFRIKKLEKRVNVFGAYAGGKLSGQFHGCLHGLSVFPTDRELADRLNFC